MIIDFPDHLPPAQTAPIESKKSPYADAGGGGAIVISIRWPGPGGTAMHQPPNAGYTEARREEPIDPVHVRRDFRRR